MTAPAPRPPFAWWWAAPPLAILVGLGLLVGHDNWITRADADIVRAIALDRTDGLTNVAKAITDCGDRYVLIPLVVIAWLVAWRRGPREFAPWLPALALTLGAVLTPLLKLAVGRPRPPAELAAVVMHSPGYPSGHSSQSMATFLAIAVLFGGLHLGRRRWLALAAGCAVIVGLSRVVLAVHSPTDLLGGWSLGVLCVMLAGAAAWRRPQRTGTATADGRAVAAGLGRVGVGLVRRVRRVVALAGVPVGEPAPELGRQRRGEVVRLLIGGIGLHAEHFLGEAAGGAAARVEHQCRAHAVGGELERVALDEPHRLQAADHLVGRGRAHLEPASDRGGGQARLIAIHLEDGQQVAGGRDGGSHAGVRSLDLRFLASSRHEIEKRWTRKARVLAFGE